MKRSSVVKKIVDALLVFSLILSFCSWEHNLTTHIIVGIAFCFLMTVHIFLNKKWLVSVAKTFKARIVNKKVKLQYSIDIVLIVLWSIAILSGFPTIGFSIGEKENLFMFSWIHGVSARLGGLFILIHVYQHRKQISSYIKRKKI